jgi:hypothetical protein
MNFYRYVGNSPLDFVDPFGWASNCPLFGACTARRHPNPKQLPGRPKPLAPPVVPTAVQSAFDSFTRCLDKVDSECDVDIPELPKVEPPAEGHGGEPGPADFGVAPNEVTTQLPDYKIDELLRRECDCLKANPLATLDKRYQYDLSGTCVF